MQNRNRNNPVLNYLKMFFVTTLSAALATAVLLLLSAVLLEKLGLTESQARYIIYAVYLVTAMAAGMIAGKWQREKKFMWGALAGIVWFVLVLVISLCFGGAPLDTGQLFPAAVCMVGGGMLGGMLA